MPPPSAKCSRTMHHGGSIAILGIPPDDTAIDWNQVIFKGLTLKGIYGREMFETWYKMSALLQSGLEHRPDHHPSLPDRRSTCQGFETMGSGKSGKVILDWSTLVDWRARPTAGHAGQPHSTLGPAGERRGFRPLRGRPVWAAQRTSQKQ